MEPTGEPANHRAPLTHVRAMALCAILLPALGLGIGLTVWNRPTPPGSGLGADDLRALRQDANRLLQSGELTMAEALARKLLSASTGDAESHLLLAECVLGQGRLGEAYEQTVLALKLTPENADRQVFAGAIAAKLERWEDAVAHDRMALSHRPDDAKTIVHLGTALLKLGRLDEAEAQARRAHELDPSLPESTLLRAKVADERGQHDAAMKLLDEGRGALKLSDPRRLDFTVYRAIIFHRTGRTSDAIGLLTGLKPRDQQREEVVEALAVCYLDSDEPAKAAAVWGERFALDPRNARAAGEAGMCLLRAGDAAGARRYLSYAQALDPEHAKVLSLAKALQTR